MDKEVELSPISPIEVINEAMQVALSRVINRTDLSLVQSIAQSKGIRDAQERLTDGQCMRASEEVLKFIFEKHADSFDLGVILSISNRVGKSFKDGDHWGNHALFLVHHRSGSYFIGSPANLRRKNFALNTYQGKSVEEALAHFEEKESGPFNTWNFAELEQVIDTIKLDGDQTPILDDNGGGTISSIRWDKQGFHHNIVQI